MKIVVEYSRRDEGISEPGAFLRVDIGNGRFREMTTGLLDSGASMSMVPQDLLARLDARPVGAVPVGLATGPVVERRVFRVDVRVPILGLEVRGTRVLATSTWAHALLGRDILRLFVVTLDGPGQRFMVGT